MTVISGNLRNGGMKAHSRAKRGGLAKRLVLTICAGLPIVGGCLFRVAGEDEDLHADLARGDAIFERRVDEEMLLQAIDAYGRAIHLHPTDPAAYAGLARAFYARAYGFAPEDPGPLVLYEKSREVGWRCLRLVPSFSAMVADQGYGSRGVTPQAARRIPQSHRECLVWTLAAWVRWADLRDPGAVSIDLASMRVLADRALELETLDQHGLGTFWAGMVAAVAPMLLGVDHGLAAERLAHAMKAEPSDLSRVVDYAEKILLPEGRVEEALDLLRPVAQEQGGRDSSAYALENRRARARAEVLTQIATKGNTNP